MHTRSATATAWLGLTPEPERSLPELLAYLQDDPSESVDQYRAGPGHPIWFCVAPAGAGCATSTGPPGSRWR